ncbi:MAG: hypothetical protein JXR82_05785 [Marinifilaceae bacterium]|nr:hypothetical protein [Marinifilaceae bacterium]
MRDTTQHNIERIKSDSLRKIAEFLIKNGIQITFFGQAWSNVSADWIYFDTILDLDRLRIDFKLKDNIIVHENLDPKSGTEKGFIDKLTGEGLIGKLR